jgi:hypothetical protein
MSTQIIKAGRIVAKSKNLRGLLDYARKHAVTRIETIALPSDQGSMRVFFKDGAECRANFNSFKVMTNWIKARRSWANAERVNY